METGTAAEILPQFFILEQKDLVPPACLRVTEDRPPAHSSDCLAFSRAFNYKY